MWKAAVRSVRDDGVPVGRVDLEERPDLRQAGVVDEPVDATEPLDDALDEGLRLRAVGDVGGEGLGLGGTCRADALEGRRGRVGRRCR